MKDAFCLVVCILAVSHEKMDRLDRLERFLDGPDGLDKVLD